MTLKDAENIVHEYGSVLAAESATDGPASYASRLPDSPERIIQAMKLWLAHDIQNGSLTEEFRNQVGTVASRLPRFINDEKARRLNTSRRTSSVRAKSSGLSLQEFKEAVDAIKEVDDWTDRAMLAGLSLRRDLSEFIAAVEQFDPADSLYWQRVYTLAGLEHSPIRKSAEAFVPKNYKVARNGVEIGEFEPFDFFEGVHHGKIRQDDWFWMEGMGAWKWVSDLKILEEFHKLPPGRPQKQAKRSWFRRRPTQQKYVQAAITVATNLYLHTIPGAEDALVPVPLKFSLPDSRFRYLMFCLSTAITAALVYDEKREIQPEALVNGCLQFATWAGTEMAQEYFDNPASSQDSVNSATAFLQEFLSHWSRWPELEKEGKSTEITDLICFMIQATESDEPAGQTDEQRLGQLGLEIQCRLPAMRGAFIELANR